MFFLFFHSNTFSYSGKECFTDHYDFFFKGDDSFSLLSSNLIINKII